MTIEEMQEQKKRLRYTYQQIALMSGVPEGTVQKVLGGITKNPRIETVESLEKVLRPHSNVKSVRYSSKRSSGSHVAEAAAKLDDDVDWHPMIPEWARTSKYPRQGSYTLADYLAIPDGQRVELIDGVIYDMASPALVHQDIQLDIAMRLKQASGRHPDCRVYNSPFDVQLDKDDRTVVQPDIFVVCHKDRLSKKKIVGAPDLVIEILSPSTRKKDIEVKYSKYAHAGVQEYWMVDPDRQQIYVTVFADDDRISIYTFDDKVPVWISGGDIEVDFSEIKQDIAYIDTINESSEL